MTETVKTNIMKQFFIVIGILLGLAANGQNVDSLITSQINSKTKYLEQQDNHLKKLISEQDSLIVDLNKKVAKINQKGNSDIVVSVISVLVALGLLIITFQNNKNSKSILQQQINEQKIVNRAQLRPIVHAYRNGFKEKTELIMINYGGGPAVIKEISFIKDNVVANTISGFIDIKEIDSEIWWDDRWTFSQEKYYLYPHQKEKLYTITKSSLITKYKKNEADAESIIDKVREGRKGIVLRIKYTDVISLDDKETEAEYIYELPLVSE